MTFKKESDNISYPIKILFFIESLCQGGRERQLVELLKQLIKNPDFQCELVIMRKDVFYNEVYDLDINIHIIERNFIKKDPVVFFKFYNLAKRINPEIVQPWGPMTAAYSLYAKMVMNFKLVNFQIQNAPIKPRFSYLNRKLTFYFSDIIIGNSVAGLKSYQVPMSKSKVIRNGFDLDRLNRLKPEKYVRNNFIITTELVISMVGRFSNDKDFSTYIKAAQIILEKNYQVTFLCIGNGDSEKYEKLIESNFTEKIRILPQQIDIESIMNICDIGVLSTYTEGISNVLMEFMALGKPVVATDGSGTKELVIDGKTGYLIPPKSPEILAEKIQFLLDNPKIAKKLGINGCNRIKNKFNMEKMVNEFVNIYYEVTNA